MTASIRALRLELPIYSGPRPRRDWRKPIVGPPDSPFAELRIAGKLAEAGWIAAWVQKPGLFRSSWEPRQCVQFPKEALSLYAAIEKKTGGRAGCWDVFAWRAGEPLFVELKRAGSSDRLRAPQLRWREAALALGISGASFLLAEWSGGCVN